MWPIQHFCLLIWLFCPKGCSPMFCTHQLQMRYFVSSWLARNVISGWSDMKWNAIAQTGLGCWGVQPLNSTKKSMYSNANYFMITFNIVKIRYLTYYNSLVAKLYYVHKSALNTRIIDFFVWLTVHPDTTLGKWPTSCKITLYNTFITTILYMFWATPCSSSGGRIVLIQHLV